MILAEFEGEIMSRKLTVIFPGIGYHCDKPLLYYSRRITMEMGFDECINVNYSYAGGNLRGDEEKMRLAFKSLYEQTVEELSEVKWDEYDRILFISKSIGTAIALEYAYSNGMTNVSHILYTPLKNTLEVGIFNDTNAQENFCLSHSVPGGQKMSATLRPRWTCGDQMIAFLGTADPWSNIPELAEDIRSNLIPLYIYEGANHSLETEDTIRNLDILCDVMQKSSDFIAKQADIDLKEPAKSFFISNNERTSTAYHEFYKGRWDGHTFWKDDSIFLRDDIMADNRHFLHAIKRVVPKFDPYGVTEISKMEWNMIQYEIIDESAADMYAEADKWVQETFKECDCFTILGL